MNSNTTDTLEKVRTALGELLPAMVADGGGADLVCLDDGEVTIRLKGTCLYCPSRELTAAALMQEIALRVPGMPPIRIDYPAMHPPKPDSGLISLP